MARRDRAKGSPRLISTPLGPGKTRRSIWLALIIVAAGIWAYSTSFAGVLIGDDDAAIAKNASIQSIATSFSPPADTTVAGRPIANLTFALNYAAAGGTTDLWGYHAVNLTIHVLAGLMLFGVIRRTLLAPALRDRFGAAAAPLAFSMSLIWIVHPLNTQAVTFLVQRVESLMGLFYLTTLYCTIRAAESEFRDRAWIIGAVVACALGMATKETMVSAPIVAALWIWICWPRVRITGRPMRLLAGLAATWVIVVALALTAARTQSTGLDAHGWTPLLYLRTQAGVIVHYLRLAFWPKPLVFQYGWLPASSWVDVLPQTALLASLAAATVFALIRRLPIGLVGACFFLILAPSSSILPVATEVAAEHRMYLPLAAVVAVVVLGIYGVSRRFAGNVGPSRIVGWIAVPAATVFLGQATYARNRVYESPDRMALDVVTNRPQNAQARLVYGTYLIGQRRFADAEAYLNAALALPLPPSTNEATTRAVTHLYLGLAQLSQNKLEVAVGNLQEAISLRPDSDRAYGPLAEAQLTLKRPRDAVQTLEQAITRRPDDAVLLKRAAWVLATSSDAAARNGARAIDLATHAVTATQGRDPIALDTLAAAYAEAGQFDRALDAVQRALGLAPAGDTSGLTQMLHTHAAMFEARQPVRSHD